MKQQKTRTDHSRVLSGQCTDLCTARSTVESDRHPTPHPRARSRLPRPDPGATVRGRAHRKGPAPSEARPRAEPGGEARQADRRAALSPHSHTVLTSRCALARVACVGLAVVADHRAEHAVPMRCP
eukprot:1571999-Prymnesium_polylepis.1